MVSASKKEWNAAEAHRFKAVGRVDVVDGAEHDLVALRGEVADHEHVLGQAAADRRAIAVPAISVGIITTIAKSVSQLHCVCHALLEKGGHILVVKVAVAHALRALVGAGVVRHAAINVARGRRLGRVVVGVPLPAAGAVRGEGDQVRRACTNDKVEAHERELANTEELNCRGTRNGAYRYRFGG